MDNVILEGLFLVLLLKDDTVHQPGLCTGEFQSIRFRLALLHRQVFQGDHEEDAHELLLVGVTLKVHTDQRRLGQEELVVHHIQGVEGDHLRLLHLPMDLVVDLGGRPC